ncbi:hypothetical protein FHT40_003130 [Mycolicibacterium sp. BK556]|uniref:DUF2561 family protein n=1 Tax=Mycobacteriaceae TaxID=1762 RepID=UPI00105CBC37|nr:MULTISPECIES: DUF2561 family protein [Mycobacteriaceae]MBB3603469.1 hypothetical protein [Mycolicibacterium sp. BK556]MBB3633664.1 hypothetical protein [Mycolicibacterium sp. BK607]MBB3751246.1 hypothetical protein [Mycolicibacterium sp. BK634]TDO11778.1 uncharacterized protein DUF2561 [Mycobacterium sp. BK086]
MAADEEDRRSPETVDRLLVGVCGAIWLVLLAVTVIAIVALVDMSRGHTAGNDASRTPWLLYSIIVVSALIIVGAIPLLIRARRTALADARLSPPDPAKAPAAQRSTTPPVAPVRGTEAPTEKLKVFGSTVDPYERYQPDFAQSSASRRADPLIPATELDRLWLRCTVMLAGAIGLALVGVSTATYLLAVDNDTAAWVGLGLAAVITIAMPAVPVTYLRQLHGAVEEAVPV